MNLLLLLQALALLAALVALSRPVAQVGGLEGSDTLLLIDVSASMQATDGGPGDDQTRLERAKQEALRLIDDLSYGDRAMIIVFAQDATVLTPLTESKGILRQALADLRPTDLPSRLSNALYTVQGLLAETAPQTAAEATGAGGNLGGERQQTLFVFSDGRVDARSQHVALDAEVEVHYIKTGRESANVGLVGVDVRSSPLEEWSTVLAAVHNAGAQEVEVGVDFLLADDLLDSARVTVPPGETVSVPYEAIDVEGRVRVRLDHTAGGRARDPLPVDDEAFALIRPRAEVNVLLVTSGNRFLLNALSEDPTVAVTPRGLVPTLPPASFNPDDPSLLDYDLIVLDRFSPETLPPGNYMLFGAAPSFEGFTDEGLVRDPQVLDWDETHELARFVNFATLALYISQRLSPREQDTVVVRSDKGPLVVEARDGDRHAVVCAFDLMSMPEEGAWVFQPSFPIFLANVVSWMGGGGRDRKDTLLTTGGTAQLRFPAWARAARVSGPASEPYEVTLRPGDDLLRVPNLDRAGYYEVSYLGGSDAAQAERSHVFAVNLSDVEESTIEPSDELDVQGRDPVAGTEEAAEPNRELWKLLALAALVFVLFEWWVYNRRVYL
jgi:von Willebrand factor type A domain